MPPRPSCMSMSARPTSKREPFFSQLSDSSDRLTMSRTVSVMTLLLDVVLPHVLQHLAERRDQRGVFGIVDLVEHRLELLVHERPGAAELRTSFAGQEDVPHPAVAHTLLAPH